MHSRTDKWMDGWMDRCTNGQINEQMDGTVCKSGDYLDEAVLGLNRGDADLAVWELTLFDNSDRHISDHAKSPCHTGSVTV